MLSRSMSDVFLYSSPLQETGTKRRRGTRNVQKQQAALANAVSGEEKKLMAGGKQHVWAPLQGIFVPLGLVRPFVFVIGRLFPVQSAPFILWFPALETTCAHYFTVVNPIRF